MLIFLSDARWESFLGWLRCAGIGETLFTDTSGWVDVDTMNVVVSKFCRELYAAGRPYSHFAETTNSVSSKIPKLRRVLQPAWNTAFAWRRAEPVSHHVAMPWQVLIACVSIAILCGWTRVASILSLAWGGLLRIGEVTTATRCHALVVAMGHRRLHRLRALFHRRAKDAF